MDRRQALALLREILEVTKKSNVNALSLNQDSPGRFSLKISVYADEQVQNSINPILTRDKLAIKYEEGALIIYSTES